MVETAGYNEEILSVVCPVCCAAVDGMCLAKVMHGKNYRAAPHRERVWKAKGYRWYCFDCDAMVPADHIKHVLDNERQTGNCVQATSGLVREVVAA